jgi:hypothetical protein
LKTFVLAEFLREVPEEPHGIPAEKVAGHHRSTGNHTKNQPEELYTQRALFEGQYI